MYKKITHEIVEEHFAQHPMLPQFVTNEIPPGAALPAAVMNEETLMFRMDSRTAWAKYAWSLLNYSISMNAGLPGTSQVEARLLRAARMLGDFVVPYYGLDAGNTLGNKLAEIAKVGAEVVDAVKDKRSVEDFQGIWEKLIADLAKFLNSLNPSQWPESLVHEMFINLVTTWTRAIQTRYNEDWVGNEAALEDLNKLVVTGIADHVHKGYSSIADIMSRGLIAQFPTLFIK
ncbi:hypothetical protein UFOVP71_316 [uncultured Caudovirales phage]|uniref:Uncharacterized protein n=1 Tax=uncultured Caudovirales phage TaxID=2100421 RepID=A0A6J5TA16_9CAUD|nr:hypothetical protein UFOVP71_316 [uncultured Caudovirales phage]